MSISEFPEITQMFEKIGEILPFLIPILLLQWGLMVYALVVILKSQSNPKLLPKWAWILIIIAINIIGPVLYLSIGRGDD